VPPHELVVAGGLDDQTVKLRSSPEEPEAFSLGLLSDAAVFSAGSR
jgi:hypothetical protein